MLIASPGWVLGIDEISYRRGQRYITQVSGTTPDGSCGLARAATLRTSACTGLTPHLRCDDFHAYD